MKFNRIVCVDETKLNKEGINDLEKYADEVKVYHDYPETEKEVIERIGDAEAVIVSWRTQIGEEVIKNCGNLKYIGMACSLYDDESANVAVDFARERNIVVKGIFDYGDPGVAEFIISELIQLLNGYKGKQWKDLPRELTDLKVGIIGFGVTGQLLAKCLKPFGPELYYFSRTRKEEKEDGIEYLPLEKLLGTCEVISFHLPKNTEIMGNSEFDQFGNGKILINTSLGLPFDQKAFAEWISAENNYAIFDGDGKKELSENTEKMENVIAFDKSAGYSSQTLVRLSQKVLQNIADYFKEND
ncbi:dihydrofolate reductase [Gramella sp. GC03-9]|uniref:Dihydrofolate reductase n=1 Tax=Christiangramia oceanisediminis TaxID=2920386 RepID=A0A9X2I527_9FLAO|nr:NAD(P)-dependent oxidoreductase [Gramella oceanisediminis]MCP9200020.1 dihydrofolate reductase [Gramella oceanisediminis]